CLVSARGRHGRRRGFGAAAALGRFGKACWHREWQTAPPFGEGSSSMIERRRAFLAIAALSCSLVLGVSYASLGQTVELQPRGGERPNVDTLRERANVGTV